MIEREMDQFQEYINAFISDELIDKIKSEYKVWPKLENLLGHLFFGLVNFFAPAEHEEVPFHTDSEDIFPNILIPNSPRPSRLSTQYLAVNFRGLFRGNGRETIIAVYDKLNLKCNDLSLHKKLHHIYMERLCRKSESINQIFLSTTELNGISIFFPQSIPTTHIAVNGGNLTLTVGNDMYKLWELYISEWNVISNTVLSKDISDEKLREIQERLAHSRKELIKLVQQKEMLFLIGTQFFVDWRDRIPHKPPLGSALDAIVRFEQWIISLCWLAFYCNENHAGTYFYSVKLPQLFLPKVAAKSLFPNSSFSIVANRKVSKNAKDVLFNFTNELEKNKKYNKIQSHSSKVFNDFLKNRTGGDLTGNEYRLATFVNDKSDERKQFTIPIDISKLFFLLRTARLLVGQRHEGGNLHFCFIFGFSWERIESESQGVLKEVISGLNTQWKDFYESIIEPSQSEKKIAAEKNKSSFNYLEEVAKGMAKWIKNGDLPLQPWDMALFFEESSDNNEKWPIPTSIVRVCNRTPDYLESISKEFHLRRALKDLTQKSPHTVGILVLEAGLIIFARGKSIMYSHSPGLAYDTTLDVTRIFGEGNEVDEERFSILLGKLLSEGSFEKHNKRKKTYTCQVIRDLCEALVTLGHGAMIILRAESSGKKGLPPLNPVWEIKPRINGPAFDEGVLLYALMAALDGATEIRIPEGKELISFAVRKSVKSEKDIWSYNQSGHAVLSPDFKNTLSDTLYLVGKGTRHHYALAFSLEHKDDIVLTVSADGPVTIWQGGRNCSENFQPTFKP